DEQEIQLVPIPLFVQTIPGRKSKATIDLVFEALNIPSLGFKSYFVEAKIPDKIMTDIAEAEHEAYVHQQN
ncbi:hypothetical protein HHI36_019628, partial [Cryptolaemus montrouzieri]